MVHGYYSTYEQNNPIKFNPFYIGKGDTLDTEKKRVSNIITRSLEKDDESFARSEYVALSNALQRVL